MTNHWNDLQYSDVLMVIGANPAENHPIGFRWITKALKNGATLISVDPRFTRTSQLANIYGQLRSGTDIAFIGGMINYILENHLYHEEYVANYTNASYILSDAYSFEDGIFSGYDEIERKYDTSKWSFETDAEGNVLVDKTLQHPRCVFQLMKQHYSRYNLETVTSITGTDRDTYLEICKVFGSTGQVGKAGTILYAMGGTQHTVGTQNIRIFAIIQLLLGNIGIVGGGVNALRGESNVQGSTDFGLLYHSLPGYIDVPKAVPEENNLAGFLARVTPKTGYKVNNPKFIISMLKAYYGDYATKENDFGYHMLPKISNGKNYSFMYLFEEMRKGGLEGIFLWGSNPVVSSPNSQSAHDALANLKWMVAVDLWETETSAFWQSEAGKNYADIDTEVFLLPACSSYEKYGTVTNSGRWMQYRWEALPPKGESRADLQITHELALKLKELYQDENTPAARQINAMSWDYGTDHHPDFDKVAKEINGYDIQTKRQLSGFGELADDGSTACGCWIYCGFYPEEGNLSQRRDNVDNGQSLYSNWSWVWPMNRRVLYNRASCDLNGKPYNEEKALIWWDETKQEWTGYDVPDFIKTTKPTDPAGSKPFIMQSSLLGDIFATRSDGPLPEHYEPYESPVQNALSSVQFNPVVDIFEGKHNPRGDYDKYPIIGTTYRMSEHWQSGTMTRNQPWLSELASHMFVEMSEELAQEKGIGDKDEIIVTSARGEIKAYALVTKRFKPYTVLGKKVHHIGMIWYFGYKGIVTGETANKVTPIIGDANSNIPEYKAFLCDVRRA